MPSTGNPEKSDSEAKQSPAKARKKTRAKKKKAGKARRPVATKVKKARTRPKTNGQTVPAPEQHQNSAPGGASIEDARRTSEPILGANPLIGFDGREILGAIGGLFRILSIRPDLVIREQTGLRVELMQVAMGDPPVAPDPADRGLRHKCWQKKPV